MRKWSIYEQNQLLKYGLLDENLEQYGEMPVEYITGHVEFCGLDFFINSSVLIPRIETETLVKKAVEIAKSKNKPKIVDVGTGSGCIGISVSYFLKKAGIEHEITLVDITAGAIEVARENKDRLLQDQEVVFIQSNIFKDVRDKFDLILANLPYIPSDRIEKLSESVRSYEPIQALDGGINGLQLIERLLIGAEEKLEKDGAIILELDDSHKLSDLKKLTNKSIRLFKDQFGKSRFALIN